MKTVSRLIQEPYRIFFPLGCFAALLGAGYWVLFGLKMISSYAPDIHSALQMQVFVHCFILGFLMTAFPRLTGTAVSQSGEVLHMTFCILGQILLLVMNRWMDAQCLFAWTLGALVIFMMQRLSLKKGGSPPPEFMWLPFALLTAWFGVGLELGISSGWFPYAWQTAAKKMAEQGWAIGVICGAGGFLGPRLMGTFRAPSKTDPEGQKKKRMFFYALMGLLFFVSFILEMIRPDVGAGLRAVSVTASFFYCLNGFAWPRGTEFYTRMLWCSFAAIVLGLWGNALFPRYAPLTLHLLTIGGISLMIFSVATMVVLTHQGRPEALKKTLPVLWILSGAVFAGFILRACSFVDTERYFAWAACAGSVWSAAVLIWFVWMLPKIFFPASNPHDVQRMHEQAKQRIAQMRSEPER